jgi:hypothetical protein
VKIFLFSFILTLYSVRASWLPRLTRIVHASLVVVSMFLQLTSQVLTFQVCLFFRPTSFSWDCIHVSFLWLCIIPALKWSAYILTQNSLMQKTAVSAPFLLAVFSSTVTLL